MAYGLPDELPYRLRSQQEKIRIYWKKGHIAGFFFDGFINVNHTHTLTITSHPIQSGANITDHAYMEPVELNIKIIVSDAQPDFLKVDNLSEGYYTSNAQTRSIGAYKILRELQKQKRVFDVGTKFETYSNMMISSLVVSESSSNVNALDVNVTLQQILVANERYIKVSMRGQTTDDSSNINQNVEDVTDEYELFKYKILTMDLNIMEAHELTKIKTVEDIHEAFLDHASYDIDTEGKYNEFRKSLNVDPKQEFLNGTITFDQYKDYMSYIYPAG